MRIGTYFTLDEFVVSQTAVRRGLTNVPPSEAVESLRALCAEVLDPLREQLGAPIVITSGYRSKLVNSMVGGSSTSQHCAGEAADFICPGRTVEDVFELARASDLPFDQLIQEFGAWVHVSYSPRRRREALRAVRRDRAIIYQRV